MDLDIAEVAKQSGLPASTLRYYEDRNLISASGRKGQRRQYDPSVLQRLALIKLAASGGFSLDEIALMFAADGRPDIDRTQLTAKADELDRSIRNLTAMRDALRHAADCPHPRHLECPTFNRMLDAAATRKPR